MPGASLWGKTVTQWGIETGQLRYPACSRGAQGYKKVRRIHIEPTDSMAELDRIARLEAAWNLKCAFPPQHRHPSPNQGKAGRRGIARSNKGRTRPARNQETPANTGVFA